MAQELLVEEINAGKDFASEFSKKYPVSVYFWVYPAQSDRWYLYVAASDMHDDIKGRYGEVLNILQNGSQWLDPFQIKLVDTSDAIASDAIEIRDRGHNKILATHYNGSLLGGLGIESAYIYPPLSANTVSS